LINTYDDEESSEVSLVTPVQIIEEKEPEKDIPHLLTLKFVSHRMNKRSRVS
jgi:hypothetical protein